MGYVKPRKTDTRRRMGRTREAVLWKVSQFSHVGRCRKSRWHHFWQKTLLQCWEVTKGLQALRKTTRGCTVSQSTVITDQSSGDHATDTETTKSKSRESGISGSHPDLPQVRQPGEFHRAAGNMGGRRWVSHMKDLT